MRTYNEIEATARDVSPFSNGTEWEIWAANWCWAPCRNPVEAHWQDYEEGKVKEQLPGFEGGCPLILCAMMGKTPTEWLEQPDDSPDRFHCIEFREDDEDGGEPQPIPDDPNQCELFPRPEPQVRMLAPNRIAEFFDVPPELVGV